MGPYWVDVRCVPRRAAAVLCGEKGFAGDEFEAVCLAEGGARRGAAGRTGGESDWVGPSVVVFILCRSTTDNDCDSESDDESEDYFHKIFCDSDLE